MANAEKKGEELPNNKENPLIMYFQSKQDHEMDFDGRVSAQSRKNFQLVDEFDDKRIALQFGRVAEHKFIMDVQYPFSMCQGFGMALSTFDYKI